MSGLFERLADEDPIFVDSAQESAKEAAISATKAEEAASNASASAAASQQYANAAQQSASNINDVGVKVEASHQEVIRIQADVTQQVSGINTSVNEVESDKQEVITYKSEVQTLNTEVKQFHQQVLNSAQQVSDAQTQVNNAAQGVSTSVALARDWAIKESGTVDGSGYSAKYWANQAHNAAGGGVASFNGRAGFVAPVAGDYTADMVGADSKGTAASLITALKGEPDPFPLYERDWAIKSGDESIAGERVIYLANTVIGVVTKAIDSSVKELVVKDVGGKAGLNPITLQPLVGVTINNDTTETVDKSNGQVHYVRIGNNFVTIGGI